MSKITGITLAIFLPALVLYGAAAFISADLNPVNWMPHWKAVLLGIWFVVSACFSAIYLMETT